MKTLPLLLLLIAAPAAAQDTWSWNKAIPAGKAIEIKGIIGDITASPATGGNVEVIARKSARRSDPGDVKIEVVEHEGGVTICAVYPSHNGRENECLEGARGHSSTNDNDVEVDFEVRVPRGVRLTARTVSGNVDVADLSSYVEASSVSGNVRVATSDLAEASTVSGSLRVRMGRADWQDELAFSTVSGDITLEFPASLNTDVRASLLSGDIESDWPLTMTGTIVRKQVRGTIGSGGRALRLQTVSGDIELRKIN